MKKTFVYILLMLLSSISIAQNQSENLKKYWCYRERLRRDFIVVSENVEKFGVNIPAASINLTKNIIDWGDGNSGISHYLSVLSSELWLLKNNGQDYSETLKELYYAMLALERMDLYSENEWRIYNSKPAFVNEADINGCHIRDDVSENFWAEYSGHFKVSNFSSVYENSRKEISQDNIYHHMEGLALVASLVGVENVATVPVNFVNPYINNYLASQGIKNGYSIDFSLWAKDYVERYISFMQRSKISWKMKILGATVASITNHWILINPVTLQPVMEGSGMDFDTGIYYNVGAIKAGGQITGQNLRIHDPFLVNENTANAIFNTAFGAGGELTLVSWPFPFDQIFGPIDISYDRYKVSTLATNGNVLGDLTFSILRSKQAINSTQPYEHFPLFYEVLRDPSRALMSPLSPAYIHDKANIETLLNKAPQEGPTSSSYEYSYDSRCVWPERLGQSSSQDVEYPGLDYMMLHNLYYIAFHAADFKSITIPESSSDYQTGTFMGKDIVAAHTVQSTSDLSLAATNSIKLAEGFQAKHGATFSAKIHKDETLSSYTNGDGTCVGGSVSENAGGVSERSGVENEVYRAIYKEVDLSSYVDPHIIIDIEVDSSIFEPTNAATRSQGYKWTSIDTTYTGASLNPIENDANNLVKHDFVTIAPNPTSGIIQIKGIETQESFLVDVVNVNGHKVISKQLLHNDQTIDLSGLPDGVYLIRIYSEQKGVITKVIMLEKF